MSNHKLNNQAKNLKVSYGSTRDTGSLITIVQGQLSERYLPVVLCTGINAPALDGTPQSVVQRRLLSLEISEDHQVQRRGIGGLKLNIQLNQIRSVTFRFNIF